MAKIEWQKLRLGLQEAEWVDIDDLEAARERLVVLRTLLAEIMDGFADFEARVAALEKAQNGRQTPPTDS